MPRHRSNRFEAATQPLLPRAAFLRRLARHGRLAILFIAISLLIGMAGYRAFGGLSWLDSFLNASMILTGMGPVSPMTTPAAKIFAGCYALFSGLAFLSSAGILFAPIVHRALHRFHLGT
ncbi:MAG: hypothetical protein JF616_17660 [Fibrobacteres bacterium]|nr:hypothetical protein [Fibrobacterota bacterium]